MAGFDMQIQVCFTCTVQKAQRECGKGKFVTHALISRHNGNVARAVLLHHDVTTDMHPAGVETLFLRPCRGQCWWVKQNSKRLLSTSYSMALI